MNETELLALSASPATLAERASARRDELFGSRVAVLSSDAEPRDDLPAPESLQPGDHVTVRVEPNASPAQWLRWLSALVEHSSTWPERSLWVCPTSEAAAGLHRLWLVASARLQLGRACGVGVRHDLVGIRLGQVALTFGADGLLGPIDQERHLPLAGVPRPNEHTRSGLEALIRAAGLEPEVAPLPESPARSERAS